MRWTRVAWMPLPSPKNLSLWIADFRSIVGTVCTEIAKNMFHTGADGGKIAPAIKSCIIQIPGHKEIHSLKGEGLDM